MSLRQPHLPPGILGPTAHGSRQSPCFGGLSSLMPLLRPGGLSTGSEAVSQQ